MKARALPANRGLLFESDAVKSFAPVAQSVRRIGKMQRENSQSRQAIPESNAPPRAEIRQNHLPCRKRGAVDAVPAVISLANLHSPMRPCFARYRRAYLASGDFGSFGFGVETDSFFGLVAFGSLSG